MQIRIEPVKSSEVTILSAISAACFYDTFHKQNGEENMMLFLKENFAIHALTNEMLQPANHFFFARIEDEIAGYIKLSTSETPPEIKEIDSIEIARIYVLKDKIGHGVGKSLMEFAFSFAKQLDKKMIWLGVWEQNSNAISFYHNYGFKKFSEHIFMLGNDAQTDWLMKKELIE